MALKLWLDDERDPKLHCPNKGCGWTWVKTVPEAIRLVETTCHEWTDASLDHDLGLGWEEGHVFVTWMIEKGKWPVNEPQVHSQNPTGRLMMQRAIHKWFGEEAQG